MEELHKDINKKKSLYEKAKKLKPKFSNNYEAIKAFTKELELFSHKYNMSIDELIKRADSERNFNEDFSNILSLSRKIQFLKSI